MSVPDWVQDAVFYQIFPDRFANGDPNNDPPNVQPWGSQPTIWGFQGGDLRGISNRLDYLLDLGVDAIYLNPIFRSTSNHRYNTLDYFQIDPKLGDLDDFHTLVDRLHRRGMRLILDGVFNHCGRGHFAFVDVLENQEHSPYRDWFHIRHFPVDAYSPGEASDYLAWWGIKSLPKLNTDNPATRQYLLQVARYWIEQGADGWRLDVPNEIDDDSFWAEFRHAVKSINPDAYLVGEIWKADGRWVGDGHFDGLMNYPLRECVLNLLHPAPSDTSGCAALLENLTRLYPYENVKAMYNLLGSHDTERALTALQDNVSRLRLAYAFLFAYPGAPAIYYGDEIGLTGGKDPYCRAAFPWDETRWNQELRGWVKFLIRLRKSHPVLRRGAYVHLIADNRRHCFAFARRLGDQSLLAVYNTGAVTRHLRVPVQSVGWEDGRHVRNLLGQGEALVADASLYLHLPPFSAMWLM